MGRKGDRGWERWGGGIGKRGGGVNGEEGEGEKGRGERSRK